MSFRYIYQFIYNEGVERHSPYIDRFVNPFGFTGYQRENVGGMLYAQARYYDPRNGRFNAEDGARDGLNWYEYARSNPLRFVDKNGLWCNETWWANSYSKPPVPEMWHDFTHPTQPRYIAREDWTRDAMLSALAITAVLAPPLAKAAAPLVLSAASTASAAVGTTAVNAYWYAKLIAQMNPGMVAMASNAAAGVGLNAAVQAGVYYAQNRTFGGFGFDTNALITTAVFSGLVGPAAKSLPYNHLIGYGLVYGLATSSGKTVEERVLDSILGGLGAHSSTVETSLLTDVLVEVFQTLLSDSLPNFQANNVNDMNKMLIFGFAKYINSLPGSPCEN